MSNEETKCPSCGLSALDERLSPIVATRCPQCGTQFSVVTETFIPQAGRSYSASITRPSDGQTYPRTLDSIAALSREDVEAAIRFIDAGEGFYWGDTDGFDFVETLAAVARVRVALAGHLIDRSDA